MWLLTACLRRSLAQARKACTRDRILPYALWHLQYQWHSLCCAGIEPGNEIGPWANVRARVILWLNDYKTRTAEVIRPREVRLMHPGGDVSVDRRGPVTGGRGDADSRGVAWG